LEKNNVTWDLSDLFGGVSDPGIDKSLEDVITRATAFSGKYKGKIDNPGLTADLLLESILDYESILEELTRPGSYASLVFAADTSKHEHGALMQRVQEKQTEISVMLLFFDLELMSCPAEVIDKIAVDSRLDEYRHFIKSVRMFSNHRLSEPEERILEEKANTGSRAFERLFEESLAAVKFKVTLGGEVKEMTEPEVLKLLREPDRETRRAAAESFSQGLRENSRLLTYIFNTLVYDKAVDDRLRKFAEPEQSRHLANELDSKTVEAVISTCDENYSLVSRFYKVKREILGYDKLTHYDRSAPLFETHRECPWECGQGMVMDAFGRFSPEMADAAGEFFNGGWIDAQPREGKRGGAFCMYVSPEHHPYILMSYLNRLDDVSTLAHELGHGVHAYLARHNSYLNFSSALPVAELASTFGEMLVFENLVRESDLQDKLALYAEKIESVFATVFRQAAMFRFEQDLHRARREKGELTTEQISELWQKRIQAMFQDSVELGEEHRMWWMYVGHFVQVPFYVYAYSFGELMVMALYQMYKKEEPSFAPKYVELLKAGGSCSPTELLARVGIDIHDKAFWEGGVKVVEGLVADFEKFYGEWRK